MRRLLLGVLLGALVTQAPGLAATFREGGLTVRVDPPHAPQARAIDGILGVVVRSPECRDLALVILTPGPPCRVTRAHAHNLLVNTGEQYLVDAWRGAVTLSNMRFHGLGSSGAAAAETDTGCLAEFTTTRASGTLVAGASPNILQSVGVNTIAGAQTLREFCFMSQAAVPGGIMWSRVTLVAPIAGPAGGTVTTTYEITFE